jgi:methyl-CpG-binding domain protein 4
MSIINPLGLQCVRAKRLIRLSTIYVQYPPSTVHTFSPSISTTVTNLQSPPSSPSKRRRYPHTPISHLPGTGPYALDSYRIFCTSVTNPGAWKEVMPTDKELVKYLVS